MIWSRRSDGEEEEEEVKRAQEGNKFSGKKRKSVSTAIQQLPHPLRYPLNPIGQSAVCMEDLPACSLVNPVIPLADISPDFSPVPFTTFFCLFPLVLWPPPLLPKACIQNVPLSTHSPPRSQSHPCFQLYTHGNTVLYAFRPLPPPGLSVQLGNQCKQHIRSTIKISYGSNVKYEPFQSHCEDMKKTYEYEHSARYARTQLEKKKKKEKEVV